MTNEVAVHGVEPWRERLGLPAYRVVDAARYCGLSPRDIRAWVRGFVDYDSATGARTLPLALSYYELVEVAFVATFFGVGAPLSWIRRVRKHAVQELRSEYPFVQESWRNEGHLLLHGMGIGDGPDLGDYLFTTDCCREAGWSGSVLELFEQFDYEYELAFGVAPFRTWQPRAGGPAGILWVSDGSGHTDQHIEGPLGGGRDSLQNSRGFRSEPHRRALCPRV